MRDAIHGWSNHVSFQAIMYLLERDELEIGWLVDMFTDIG